MPAFFSPRKNVIEILICYLHGILIVKIEQGLAKCSADLLVVLNGEVRSASRADFGAAHRSLHGITVLYSHRPYDNSARAFLPLLDVKFTVLEGELES